MIYLLFLVVVLTRLSVSARSYKALMQQKGQIEQEARPRRAPRLPQFAHDYSDLLISAVIERSFKSKELHLTMIFMGHKALRYLPQMPFLWVNNSDNTIDSWRKVVSIWKSSDSVDNIDSNITCSFNVSAKHSSKAQWLPESSTVNSGFNKNIKVLRCAIPSGTTGSRERRSKDRLSVKLLRGSISLFDFEIPWATRCTGFGANLFRKLSSWDPWVKNYQLRNIFFLCLSIVRPLEPFRMDTGLPMLLENIEHHLKMGFRHIFIGLYLDRRSVHMQRYRLALDPWVSAGLVSLMTLALPGYDDVAGFQGVVFIDDYVRYIHQINCLYLSKGIAHRIAFFHSSEFLMLNPDISNVKGLLSIPSYPKTEPCYMIIQSLGVPDPQGVANSFGPGDNYWTNQFFATSHPIGPMPAWASIIVNTELAWLVSWREAGACGNSTSVNNSTKPWTMEIVKPEIHGFTVPIEEGKLYFYRGWFEVWQLKRQIWPINEHIKYSATITVKELAEKGFKIDNLDLKFRCNVGRVLELYPSYLQLNHAYKSDLKRSILINVSLSATRTKIWEAKLSFDVPKEYRRKYGSKSIENGGTWHKCNPEKRCNNFEDVIVSVKAK